MQNASKLIEILNKKSRLIIGLMSGMSYDGLDIALVSISGEFPNLNIELLDSDNIEFNNHLKDTISNSKNFNTEQISQLNFKLGAHYAESVNNFINTKKINKSDIDAIGSHGLTIYHKTINTSQSSTLQIGSGSIIANKTGIITISNFREADVSEGGQGAPLVPYVDYLLYKNNKDIPISLNNLGSISNLTVVTKNLKDVFAFDTGPANMPIDHFARQIPDNKFGIDINGEISRSGKLIEPMLTDLLNNNFFKLNPPKAAGYDEFGPNYCSTISKKYLNYSSKDHLRTAVEFTATTITNAYKDFVFKKFPDLKNIIFTGGGAKNLHLIELIQKKLPNININSKNFLSKEFSDSKEALSFAVLANEFLSQRPANLPNVTGANKSVILGTLNLP